MAYLASEQSDIYSINQIIENISRIKYKNYNIYFQENDYVLLRNNSQISKFNIIEKKFRLKCKKKIPNLYNIPCLVIG